MPEPEYTVRRVPMHDTGLGREAGYANDKAMIEAAKRMRAEIEAILTPEALARFDAAEDEITRRILFGA
jgi:hypothetical protein